MMRLSGSVTTLAFFMAACSSSSPAGDGRGALRDGGDTGGTSQGGGSSVSGGASGAGGATSSGGATGSVCKTSGECVAPAICKVCADGTSSCASGACVAGHCTVVYPPCRASDGGVGPADAAGTLSWFATCGPPVCRAPQSGDSGSSSSAPPCTTEKVGAACSSAGAECDTGNTCNGPLTCAATDPKHGGTCPISRAKYKQDIQYLGSDERAKLAEDVQSIPLVRYRYKDGPEREHLGFIIEDVEPSPGVDSQRDQVDLYGFTSMAVAAIQEQHREIQALQREIAELRRAVGKEKGGPASAPTPTR